MDRYKINKTVVLTRLSIDSAIEILKNTNSRYALVTVLEHLAKSKEYLFTLKNLVKED